jgi:pyruvate dehydrogenase E2 component (dihydrolipoamide acetyltransferase)
LPAGVQVIEIDMTKAEQSIQLLRAKGQRVTFTHVIIRAAGMALASNPPINRMLAGNRCFSPTTVKIGISVATGCFVAPVLVISDPDKKAVMVISEEMEKRLAGLREESEVILRHLRRWGWVVPFSFARRWLLRLMARNFAIRQNMSGTIQITSLPGSDIVIPLIFGSTAVLGVGRICNRVVAVDGQPAVRPTLNLVCTADHRVWDGRAGETFLKEIKKILETGVYDQVSCVEEMQSDI